MTKTIILNDSLIASTSDYDILTVDKDYKLFAVKNVCAYDNKTPQTFDIEVHTTVEPTSDSQYYFVIDTWQDEAFSHWIFESAIYLRIFTSLKRKFPAIKLLLKARRDYKNLFIKYYNISTDDITYEISQPSNICIFPSPISMLNDSPLNDKFKIYLYRLINDMNTPATKAQKKDIDILLMPRQKKENLKDNDRINDSTDIETGIQAIPNITTSVFHTDNVKDIYDQIRLIKRSKTLIVTDGSPFLVNGIFCKNMNVIVLGNIVNNHGARFKKLGLVKEYIEENNKVTYIPYVHGNFYSCRFLYADIKPYLKLENNK